MDLVFPVVVTLQGMVWAVTAGEYLRVQAGLDYCVACLVLVKQSDPGVRNLSILVLAFESIKGQ